MSEKHLDELIAEEMSKIPDLISARIAENTDENVVHAIMTQAIKQAYRRAVRKSRLQTKDNGKKRRKTDRS